MYPNLKKLRKLLSSEFTSLNSRNRILELLSTDEKEEKWLQLFMNWLMLRYKLDKDTSFTFIKESEDWASYKPNTSKKEKCDFILDDYVFDWDWLRAQNFIELKYINWNNLATQIEELKNQLKRWYKQWDNSIWIIFHEFKNCNIKSEYKNRCEIISEILDYSDYNNKIEITSIEILEDWEYAYKIDIYTNSLAYNILEKDEIIVGWDENLVENFIYRFDKNSIIKYEHSDYYIFTDFSEFLENINDFYKEHGTLWDYLSINYDNDTYWEVIEFIRNLYLNK